MKQMALTGAALSSLPLGAQTTPRADEKSMVVLATDKGSLTEDGVVSEPVVAEMINSALLSATARLTSAPAPTA